MALILAAPDLETFDPRYFDGLVRSHTMETRDRIPAQWMDYNAAAENRPGDYFGVVFNFDRVAGTFDYLCGQEVETGGLVSIAGLHARFATEGHITTIHAVWDEIYGYWLAQPEYRPAPGPAVEYYPPEFDGKTGLGGYEIWVPLEV